MLGSTVLHLNYSFRKWCHSEAPSVYVFSESFKPGQEKRALSQPTAALDLSTPAVLPKYHWPLGVGDTQSCFPPSLALSIASLCAPGQEREQPIHWSHVFSNYISDLVSGLHNTAAEPEQKPVSRLQGRARYNSSGLCICFLLACVLWDHTHSSDLVRAISERKYVTDKILLEQ